MPRTGSGRICRAKFPEVEQLGVEALRRGAKDYLNPLSRSIDSELALIKFSKVTNLGQSGNSQNPPELIIKVVHQSYQPYLTTTVIMPWTIARDANPNFVPLPVETGPSDRQKFDEEVEHSALAGSHTVTINDMAGFEMKQNSAEDGLRFSDVRRYAG